MATTRDAPARAANIDRMPVPQPTSITHAPCINLGFCSSAFLQCSRTLLYVYVQAKISWEIKSEAAQLIYDAYIHLTCCNWQ